MLPIDEHEYRRWCTGADKAKIAREQICSHYISELFHLTDPVGIEEAFGGCTPAELDQMLAWLIALRDAANLVAATIDLCAACRNYSI